MGSFTTTVCCAILLLVSVVLIIPPSAAAANGTVSIEYSGSGGGYVGDMFFFSGRDTAGSTVLLKIAGPNLPAAGLPISNLTGSPGSGTPIEVGSDGIWKFLWYSGQTSGNEKLQTARYTIIAEDASNPELSSESSIFLKTPEFSATIQPNPAPYGDYVTINGVAERGMDYVEIDVSDTHGMTCRTYMAPIAADGYFQYSFHAGIPPGQYIVHISNPPLQKVLNLNFKVMFPGENATISNATPSPMPTTGSGVNESMAQPQEPSGKKPFLPVPLVVPVIAVILAGIGCVVTNRRH